MRIGRGHLTLPPGGGKHGKNLTNTSFSAVSEGVDSRVRGTHLPVVDFARGGHAMTRLFRSLLYLTAVLGAAAAGAHFLWAQPAEPAPAPPPRTAPPLAPVRVTDAAVEMKFAVKPKELSTAVKKGLEYLVKSQQDDGGWSQGGGWRNNTERRPRRGEGPSRTRPTSATPASRCSRSSAPATRRPRASTRTRSRRG